VKSERKIGNEQNGKLPALARVLIFAAVQILLYSTVWNVPLFSNK
jgi:hypothetical protein